MGIVKQTCVFICQSAYLLYSGDGLIVGRTIWRDHLYDTHVLNCHSCYLTHVFCGSRVFVSLRLFMSNFSPATLNAHTHTQAQSDSHSLDHAIHVNCSARGQMTRVCLFLLYLEREACQILLPLQFPPSSRYKPRHCPRAGLTLLTSCTEADWWAAWTCSRPRIRHAARVCVSTWKVARV